MWWRTFNTTKIFAILSIFIICVSCQALCTHLTNKSKLVLSFIFCLELVRCNFLSISDHLRTLWRFTLHLRKWWTMPSVIYSGNVLHTYRPECDGKNKNYHPLDSGSCLFYLALANGTKLWPLSVSAFYPKLRILWSKVVSREIMREFHCTVFYTSHWNERIKHMLAMVTPKR